MNLGIVHTAFLILISNGCTKRKGRYEYQEFLYEVEKKMNQKLKGGITASVHIAVKNNGRIKKGILIEDPAVNISPTIYLEEFYEQFQQGEPFESILLEVMRFYEAVKYEEPWDTGK